MFVHNNIYVYMYTFRIAAAVSRLDAVNNISMQRKEHLISVQKMVSETDQVKWRTLACTVLVVGLPVYYIRLFILKSYLKDMCVHHTSNAYVEHTTHQKKCSFKEHVMLK